jgi:hypothetical protein
LDSCPSQGRDGGESHRPQAWIPAFSKALPHACEIRAAAPRRFWGQIVHTQPMCRAYTQVLPARLG